MQRSQAAKQADGRMDVDVEEPNSCNIFNYEMLLFCFEHNFSLVCEQRQRQWQALLFGTLNRLYKARLLA